MKNKKNLTVPALLILTVMLCVCSWYNVLTVTAKENEQISQLSARAEEYVEQKIYYDALLCYLEIDGIQKNDYDNLICIADMYCRLGDSKNMLKYIEQAEQINPGRAETYEYSAKYYYENGDYTETMNIIKKASLAGAVSSYLSELEDELFGVYTEKYLGYESISSPFEYEGTVIWKYEYNGKYGLCDSEGNKLVKPEYDAIGTCSTENGLVSCEADGELFYIDLNGNRRLSVAENYKSIGSFGCDYAPVRKDRVWGYIDVKKTEYNFIYSNAGAFSNGLAAVKKGNNWGLINTDLIPVTGYKYSSILTDEYGFCSQYGIVIACSEEKYVFLDLSGNQIGTNVFYDARLPASSDGLIAVRENSNEGWCFATRDGIVVLKTDYEDAGSFSCGLAPVYKDGKWGYIDAEGNVVIDFIFSGATEFSTDGSAAVKKYTNWFFIRLCRFQ